MTLDANWLEKYHAEQKAEGERGKAYLLGLLPTLKSLGVAKLVTHYDGSGDSGEIQSIKAFADAEADHEGWKTEGVLSVELDDGKIDQAVCNILSGQDIDWYNNDGGYGYVILDVATGKILIEDNARFSDSTYSEREV